MHTIHGKTPSAFTLIELLVVIGIIAILSVVVVTTLNPAQLLAQARDSTRLSDLSIVNTALGTYITDQSSANGFSLGSTTVTYVSLIDPTATSTLGTDCTGIGGNFTSGGYFHCAASSTAKNVNGTGWIPINFTKMSTGAPVASLPLDPTNSSSSNLYYLYQTNGTTYKLQAFPEANTNITQTGQNPTLFSQGPNLALDGGSWVLVPGNPSFNTQNFYIMQYDAGCADGNGNAVNDHDTGNQTYSNSGEACTAANGRQISSLTGTWPVANISQTNAALYCASIGAHLVTNNEWQTMAWNVENQGGNWSGGVVASGTMGRGNSNASYAEPAGSNPEGYSGSGTSTYYSDFTHLRTESLANGSVVWDIAGNVWEWVNATTTGTNEPNAGVGTFSWHDFTALTTYGGWTQAQIGPANSAWNSTQNIGQIYSEGETDSAVYGFIRGGGWGVGSDAGVETLDLSLLLPTRTTTLGSAVPGSRDVAILNLKSSSNAGRPDYLSKNI